MGVCTQGDIEARSSMLDAISTHRFWLEGFSGVSNTGAAVTLDVSVLVKDVVLGFTPKHDNYLGPQEVPHDY